MLGASAVAGAQAVTLADRAAAIERVLTEREGYRVVVGHISRVLVLSVDTLRAEQAQTGLGWGQILIAHRISGEAKVGFDQIVAGFKSGKSWEDLARTHNVDLEKLAAVIQQSQSLVEQRREDRAHSPIGGTPSVAPPGGGMPAEPGRRGY